MEKLPHQVCPKCGKTYELSDNNQNYIRMCAENGWEQFSLKCPHCLEFITTYPMIIMGLKDHVSGKDTKLFFCPSPGCTGFVEEDPDHKGLYGCSHCSEEWHGLDEVYRAIGSIIEKYPYRKKVYLKRGKKYKSIAFDKEPDWYAEKVEEEEIE